MKDILIIWGSFFAVGALFTLWENRSPAVPFGRRPLVRRDAAAFATIFVYFLTVGVLTSLFLPALLESRAVAALRSWGLYETPLWLRVVVFYLVWDMLMYWVHRLMHHPLLWRIHKWHHSPRAIWWFVGVRGSLPHIALTYLPFLSFYLLGLPTWLVPIVSVTSVIGNAWMHVNVGGDWMRYLEYVFVTPRFHRIHHSDQPQHYVKNLGSMFTFWDRLFGTYQRPETVAAESLRFGTGERLHPVRLALGL